MSDPAAPALQVVVHSVTAAASTCWLLSQARSAPVTVDGTRLVVSWQTTGPVRIEVTSYCNSPGSGMLPFNARHRDLEDLESTHPGAAAELRSAVPLAACERGTGV